MQPDGSWAVDEPAFAAVEETLRREIAGQPSVLGLVSCYNGYVQYILRQLALSLSLRGDQGAQILVRPVAG